ncbi:MAG: hypothetical protein DI603_16485 [Roseateles depolymerans]|uniref:TonB C-terminal domain-containing protein n=1 Tax=Roseateles depolymerans TaxID=76731 RepID=A0A2W5DKJ9_9BURK|nr:MAG: hypothetical protein DI603_16485 [Roseateles depolymerans]
MSAAVPAGWPQARRGSRAGRSLRAWGVSLAVHALVLSLSLGGEGWGLPGLQLPWQTRRAEVPVLRVVLASLPAPAEAAAETTEQGAAGAPADGAELADAAAPTVQGAPPSTTEGLVGRLAGPAARVDAPVDAPAQPPVPAAVVPSTGLRTEPAAATPPALTPLTVPSNQRARWAVAAASQALPAPASVWESAASMPSADPTEAASAAAPAASAQVAPPVVARVDAAERLAAERAAAEQREAERRLAAQQEATRREAERQQAARLEAARAEAARLEGLRLAQATQERARQDALRREAERAEAERRQAIRLEAARAETARLEAERVEAARQEAARAEQVRQQRAREEALRREAERVETARQEATRLEAARLEAVRQEAARAEAARREAERLEAARQEARRQAEAQAAAQAQQQARAREAAAQEQAAKEQAAREALAREQAAQQAVRDAAKEAAARQAAAREAEANRQRQAEQALREREAQSAREAREAEERREARLRAIGQQLNEEAARRDAASRSDPAWKPARRGRLFGRSDANAEMVAYAEAWARKIQLNPTLALVRDAASQPHTDPIVTVAVRSDGSVESITLVRSSGVPALDEAVRRIVQSQERYAPFSPALLADYDVVEIRRTWHFDSAVRLY